MQILNVSKIIFPKRICLPHIHSLRKTCKEAPVHCFPVRVRNGPGRCRREFQAGDIFHARRLAVSEYCLQFDNMIGSR